METSPNIRAEVERPRRIPIHAALVRPVLFGGADRELALSNGIICLALLLGIGVSRYTLGVVVFLATIGHLALVRASKADAGFRRVYLRHVRLRSFYPAAGSARTRRVAVYAAAPVTE